MSGGVEVRVEQTPNPNARKFTVSGGLWTDSARTVAGRDQAFGLPLAARLLDIPGVRSLFFLHDFVTVTREPDAGWDRLADNVKQTIEAFYHG
jgi:hypothetical protein